MVNYISILVFIVLGAVGAAVTGIVAQAEPFAAGIVGVVWLLADIVLSSGIKMAAQWEKVVVFRMGKY